MLQPGAAFRRADLANLLVPGDRPFDQIFAHLASHNWILPEYVYYINQLPLEAETSHSLAPRRKERRGKGGTRFKVKGPRDRACPVFDTGNPGLIFILDSRFHGNDGIGQKPKVSFSKG
jgi:hypothetical protein